MSEKAKQRTILLFYLSKVFGAGIMFTIPSFMPFLRDHGVGFAGVAALEFTFGCVAFFLDAPTGRFADLFGRRISLLIGRLFLALGCYAYSLASGTAHFFSAEILIAAGLAFSLGADEAFLRSLFPRTESGNSGFARALSISIGIDLMSGAAACYYGPALYKISPQLPFLAATACYLAGAILVLLMQEPKRDRLAAQKTGMAAARKRCSECPILRELILFQAVVGFFLGAAVFLQEPYLRHSEVSDTSDGMIFALLGVCGGMGTFFAPRISRRFSMGSLQVMVFGVLALGLMLLSAIRSPESCFFLISLAFVRGVYPVFISRPFNAAIEDEIRATALSIKSMCFRLGDWSGKTLGLLLAAGFGVRITLLVLGVLAICTLGLLISRKRGPAPSLSKVQLSPKG